MPSTGSSPRRPAEPAAERGVTVEGAEPAIVVGAGPVGLTAALGLRALGCDVTLLEAEPAGRTRPGSRALFVHGDSLRILERMSPGLGTVIAADGVVWRRRRTSYRGREVYARNHPPAPSDRLPPYTSLRQIATEGHLLDACAAAGVELVWDARVVRTEVSEDRVTLSTEDGRSWRAPRVIAADGARSAVRRGLGIAMHGPPSERFHVVVDIADDPACPRPPERTFHYGHPAAAGRNVLVVPFAGGFQVDLQCRPDDVPEEFTGALALRSWLPAIVGDAAVERVLWCATYRFHQVLADTFTDAGRRVLLAGEAAHLFAPFGARGMNSGIADADAAASAVVLARAAVTPRRAEAAAAAYAHARRFAAESNRMAAGAALKSMQPRGVVALARRRAAALLAPRVRRLGRRLDQAPYGPRGKANPSDIGRY